MAALLVTPVYAQNIPASTVKPPERYRDKLKRVLKSKKFWIETGIVAGLAIADAESTVRLQQRCASCYEMNPIFSTRPSRGELYWKGGLIMVGERGLIAALWAKNSTAGSVVSTADVTWRAAFHIPWIKRNLEQP